MNKGLVSGLVLLTLGLICGLLLAFVNSFTAPIILQKENEIKYAALSEFYSVEEYNLEEVTLSDDAIDSLFLVTNKTSGLLEAVIYSVSKIGFNDDVRMLIAIDSNLNIVGYKIVYQIESPGYGAVAPEHDFNVTNSLISDLSGFDAISSATITSDAVRGCFDAVADRVSIDFGGAN
ncbi:MAG: FMN-binding protein [Firmicutes bacterium]|nr:FMN-binding protein [Bacillota bacterium]